MVASLTSYDDPDLGQGSPLNQVRYRYNAFAQLDREWQVHCGPVDEQTTPCVEYAYAGVADGLRLESVLSRLALWRSAADAGPHLLELVVVAELDDQLAAAFGVVRKLDLHAQRRTELLFEGR